MTQINNNLFATQTDSPATKLHKLLTESRDMVEELEKSVGEQEQSNNQSPSRHSTPRVTPRRATPQRSPPQQEAPPYKDDQNLNGSSGYNQVN